MQLHVTLLVWYFWYDFYQYLDPQYCLCGSSEERGAFSGNATKTWVEGGGGGRDLPSVCRAAPLSSLVPFMSVYVANGNLP